MAGLLVRSGVVGYYCIVDLIIAAALSGVSPMRLFISSQNSSASRYTSYIPQVVCLYPFLFSMAAPIVHVSFLLAVTGTYANVSFLLSMVSPFTVSELIEADCGWP